MGQFFLRTFMGQLLGLYFIWTDFYMGRALLVINGELKNIWPIIVVYFELGPSTTGLCWCHRPYQQLHVSITWLPCQCHQADLSLPMWILCDVAIKFVMKIIMFVMFIFVIENEFGLGFGAPSTFYDGFKMSWIKQSVMEF